MYFAHRLTAFRKQQNLTILSTFCPLVRCFEEGFYWKNEGEKMG